MENRIAPVDSNEFQVKRDRLLQTIEKLHPTWMIKFQIRPLAAGIGLGSVLRFTVGQDRTNYGDRCPV